VEIMNHSVNATAGRHIQGALFATLAAYSTCCSLLVTASAVFATDAPSAPAVREFGYEVVNSYPHDTGAFTQGLLLRDGFIYESTGLQGQSSVRKVVLETGAVIQQRSVAAEHFAEGMVDWDDRLIQLTWRSKQGFVYDLATFEPRRVFGYDGEGWGLARDDTRLIMSDGTSTLRFLDPETLTESGRIDVTFDGQPLPQLNELEYVKGEVYANVWPTDFIAIIDPETGRTTGRVDLRGLLPADERKRPVDVLNGIAYDATKDRLFVTGKLWPRLYEIRLKPKD
jgi:glutamine cyclotransferase